MTKKFHHTSFVGDNRTEANYYLPQSKLRNNSIDGDLRSVHQLVYYFRDFPLLDTIDPV